MNKKLIIAIMAIAMICFPAASLLEYAACARVGIPYLGRTGDFHRTKDGKIYYVTPSKPLAQGKEITPEDYRAYRLYHLLGATVGTLSGLTVMGLGFYGIAVALIKRSRDPDAGGFFRLLRQ